MFAKIIIGACIVAVSRAGLLAEPAYASYAAPASYASYTAPAYAAHGYGYGSHYDDHAVAHTSENTYRSAGNLHTVSTQLRTIATPYSTSNKHFTKVTNPGIYAYAAPVAIAHHAAYAAPIATHTTYVAAPIAAHAAAPIAHGAPLAIATPIATSHASHHGSALGYAADHSYGHATNLLETAYSSAIGASHVSYDSPIGIHYGY